MKSTRIPLYLREALYTQINKKDIDDFEKGLIKYHIETRNFYLNNKYLNHAKSMKLVGLVHSLRRSFGYNDIEASSYNGVKTYLKYSTKLYKYIFNKKKRLPLLEVGIYKRANKNLFIKSAHLLYHSTYNMPYRNVYLRMRIKQFYTQEYILRVNALNQNWIYSLFMNKKHLSFKTPLFVIKKKKTRTRPSFILLGFKMFFKNKNLLNMASILNKSVAKSFPKIIRKKIRKPSMKRRVRWNAIAHNLIMDFPDKTRRARPFPFLKNSPQTHIINMVLPNSNKISYTRRHGYYVQYRGSEAEYYSPIRFKIRSSKYKKRRRGRLRLYHFRTYVKKKRRRRSRWQRKFPKHAFFPFPFLLFHQKRYIKRLTPRFKKSTVKRKRALLKWTQIPNIWRKDQDVLNMDARIHSSKIPKNPKPRILSKRFFFSPRRIRPYAPFNSMFGDTKIMNGFHRGRFNFLNKYIISYIKQKDSFLPKKYSLYWSFTKLPYKHKKLKIRNFALFPRREIQKKQIKRILARYVARRGKKGKRKLSSVKIKRVTKAITTTTIGRPTIDDIRAKDYQKKIQRYTNFPSLLRL